MDLDELDLALPRLLQEEPRAGYGHLEQIVQALLALPGVVRTRTEVALRGRVPYRVLPLLKQVKPGS